MSQFLNLPAPLLRGRIRNCSAKPGGGLGVRSTSRPTWVSTPSSLSALRHLRNQNRESGLVLQEACGAIASGENLQST